MQRRRESMFDNWMDESMWNALDFLAEGFMMDGHVQSEHGDW